MKKLVFGFACVLAGIVTGTVGPRVVAQVVSQAVPQTAGVGSAHRWEQRCELKGGIGTGAQRNNAVNSINSSLAEAGREGWELVATPVAITGNNAGGVWGDLLLCYKRPVP